MCLTCMQGLFNRQSVRVVTWASVTTKGASGEFTHSTPCSSVCGWVGGWVEGGGGGGGE